MEYAVREDGETLEPAGVIVDDTRSRSREDSCFGFVLPAVDRNPELRFLVLKR